MPSGRGSTRSSCAGRSGFWPREIGASRSSEEQEALCCGVVEGHEAVGESSDPELGNFGLKELQRMLGSPRDGGVAARFYYREETCAISGPSDIGKCSYEEMLSSEI
jgi:hypothetical protein